MYVCLLKRLNLLTFLKLYSIKEDLRWIHIIENKFFIIYSIFQNIYVVVVIYIRTSGQFFYPNIVGCQKLSPENVFL